MKKLLFVLAMLFLSMAMSAEGNKVLFRETFNSVKEAADAGWASPNLYNGMSIASKDEDRWFEFNLGNTNNRNAVLNWNWNLGSGTIFDGQDVKEYTVNFKWGFIQNSGSINPSKNLIYNTEIALLSGSWDRTIAGQYVNNGQYVEKNSLRLFCITQLKGAYSENNPYWTNENDNTNYINDFYIDGNKENRITLTEGEWYDISVKVNVDTRTTDWSIHAKDGKLVKQGTGTIPTDSDPYAKGINVLLGRYNAIAGIDDVKVLKTIPGDYANTPSVSLVKVYNTKRTYLISFEEGETLHVKGTDGSETTSMKSPYKYQTEISGTLEAWTEYGSSLSEHAILDVDASVIALPEAFVNIVRVNSGFGKTYEMNVDNHDVPTRPTITLTYKYNGTGDDSKKLASGTMVNVTERGVLEVTTHADGFASSTVTINNDEEYVLDKVVDFQHMDEATLLEKGFEELEPLQATNMSGENNWSARGRMWYGIADGGTDLDGNPTYERHVVYGPDESYDGAEPIRRFFMKPSKLTETVAKRIFAPVYTWYTGQDDPNVTDGSDVAGLKINYGLGLINTGIKADDGNRINYPNGVIGIKGLSDNDYYVVYAISEYGLSSLHPLFPQGTTVANATEQYKAMNLGDGLNPINLTPANHNVRMFRGTETFSLYRIDKAISRIEIFKPKDGSTTDSKKRTIHVATAGTLPDLISAEEKYQIEELTLTGELNGTDFKFLRFMAGVDLYHMESEFCVTCNNNKTAGKLRVLDLSDAKIVSGGLEYYKMLASSVDRDYVHHQYTKPDSITTCMFADFRTLEELILPRSVKFISSDAFCDIYAAGFPVILKVLKVADGNQYYDSRDNCNAIIKKETNELIAGCLATIIPNDVTLIGDNAFRERVGLTSIKIPSNVTTIGSRAFSSSGLTSIDLPNSITSIGDYAFSWCKSLTSFKIPHGITSISAGLFCADTALSSVEIPNSVTTIGNAAFEYCHGLTSIDIPSSVTTIDRMAFEYCDGLTSIDLPSSVKTIGSSAFSYCSGLSSIEIPSSVTAIGSYAFQNCNNLKYVVSDITEPFSITDNAFPAISLFVPTGTTTKYKETEGWKSFSEIIEGTPVETSDGRLKYLCAKETKIAIVIPDKSYQDFTEVNIPPTINLNGEDFDVVSIGRGAFSGCSSMTSVVISNGISAIGEESFSGCSGLTSLEIPNSVTSIGNAAFKDCSGLTSVSIPSNIISISNNLFEGCSSLTSIEIPDGVTAIEAGAFYGCRGLTTLKIPDGVTTIGSSAFYGCSSLISMEIPNGVTSIKSSTFSGCSNIISINIPNSVTTIENFAFYGCNNLTSLIVDIQEPLAVSVYTLSNRTNTTLYVPMGCKAAYEAADYWKDFKEIREFTRDNEVTCFIEDDNTVTATGANDPTEKNIVIPESVVIDGEAHAVTAIGDGAFKDNTSLALVCIPETVEEIGDDAFAGCSGLTAIYCYNENPIPLGSTKATVRTRADGDEMNASAVFAGVDKEKCILYVPKNCSDKYRNAEGWKEFKNIVEIQSSELGDANNDAKVDSKDIDATVDYIMEGKTENFIFKNADVKTDSKINAADIVEIVNINKSSAQTR